MDHMIISEKDSTLKDILVKINENGKGIVFIVDGHKKVKGVLTDGDIKRLILAGHGLSEKVEKLINRNFVYIFENTSSEEIAQKYSDNIKVLPILDSDLHLIDFMENPSNVSISIAHPYLNGNELNYLMDALLSTWISSTGEYINRFEDGFSNYCGTTYGVATSNGTVALHLALTTLGIGVGDEVIVPDITFAATINAVLYTGATPVIVDIEEDSWCISTDEIEKAITKRTKAIIPVHIYGQPCNMQRIMEIAEKHHLYVVEDCAEAHGAEYAGRKVGTFGDIGCFSFFGNKVITTGEGGMCITNSLELNEKMRIYRDHGMKKDRKYYHEYIGFNYRMTNMQAAIGVAQLEKIDKILEKRKELEDYYYKCMKDINGVIFQKRDITNRKKITWLISILVSQEKRDKIIHNFKKFGVDTRGFFVPLSEMPIYARYAKQNTVSKRIAAMGINLPSSYDVQTRDVEKISQILRENMEE